MNLLTNRDSEALSRILLMQNMLSQLPGEKAIFEFVARGIEYLPGVARVQFSIGPAQLPAEYSASELPYLVHLHDRTFGIITVVTADSGEFTAFRPHINNLCFMMAATIDHLQRAEMEHDQKVELERRVEQRTRELARQVVETQAVAAQLSVEKERAQQYLEVSEAMIVELDKQGCIATINRRGAVLLGWQPEELLGKNWFDVAIPKELREVVREVFRQGMSGELETVAHFENEVLCKDGSLRFVAWHNVLRHDSEGRISRMLSSGVDITARKQAETALAKEKERLAVTLRSITDGVITTDNWEIIQSLNRAAEQFTGWLAQDAVGRPLSEVYRLIPTGNRNLISSQLDDADISQWKLESKNREEMIVSHLQSPIFDHQSQRVGTVIVFRDITRESAMRERMERIAKLDSIGVLAGGIAHDFNNLLSGMFGYLELAAESDDTNQIHSYITKTAGVFERARSLTSQLLTFAKGGAPVLRNGDIASVVRDSSMFALSGSNIGCDFNVADDLWPVEFDENQMSRVIDNLVINAKQAMPRGGMIRVSVSNCVLSAASPIALPGGRYVEISVQDSGEGISPSMLNRIFDPFLTTRQNGSGLGLSTSHSIVQRHGGGIDVESELGVGSTFRIYLPASGVSETMSAQIAEVVHRGKGVVLVLDDEPFLREISSAMLSSMGYEVVTFTDGQEVPEYLQRLSPSQKDAIVAALFDLTIPGGIGGAEVVDLVRTLIPNTVMVAVSGYSEGDVMSNPVAFGFTDSLAKPFRKIALSSLLKKHLTN